MKYSPLSSRVCTIVWVPKFYNFTVLLSQLVLVFHVVLHKLREGGKLLSTIQVIKVPCVLYLDVCHFSVPSVKLTFNTVYLFEHVFIIYLGWVLNLGGHNLALAVCH